jgi:hypothetical protein
MLELAFDCERGTGSSGQWWFKIGCDRTVRVKYCQLIVQKKDLATHRAPGPFIEPPKNSRADILLDLVRKGSAPGEEETQGQPDVVGEVDAGDAVEGVLGGWPASGLSSASGRVVVSGGFWQPRNGRRCISW